MQENKILNGANHIVKDIQKLKPKKTMKTMKTKNIYYRIIIGLIFLTSCSNSDKIENEEPNSNVVTDIEGNTYSTIEIGTQIWTKENLNVSKYRNGDPILQVTDPYEWQNSKTGAWCYYANQSANGIIYGKLYNWHAINDARGLAPKGWHIPSDSEWTLLSDFLITNKYNYDGTVSGNKIGKSLASANLWYKDSQKGAVGNNLTLNNSTKFTGLPAGSRWSDATINFSGLYFNTGWWSSTDSDNIAIKYGLSYTSENLSRSYEGKKYGYSIRCIKD